MLCRAGTCIASNGCGSVVRVSARGGLRQATNRRFDRKAVRKRTTKSRFAGSSGSLFFCLPTAPVIPISFLGLGEEKLSAPFAKLPLPRHSDLAVAQVVIDLVNLIGNTQPAEFFPMAGELVCLHFTLQNGLKAL